MVKGWVQTVLLNLFSVLDEVVPRNVSSLNDTLQDPGELSRTGAGTEGRVDMASGSTLPGTLRWL